MAAQQPQDNAVYENIYLSLKPELVKQITYKGVNDYLVSKLIISNSQDQAILRKPASEQSKYLFDELLYKGRAAFWHFIFILEDMNQIQVHRDMAVALRGAAKERNLPEPGKTVCTPGAGHENPDNEEPIYEEIDGEEPDGEKHVYLAMK